jgi:hypothetical protein
MMKPTWFFFFLAQVFSLHINIRLFKQFKLHFNIHHSPVRYSSVRYSSVRYSFVRYSFVPPACFHLMAYTMGAFRPSAGIT